MIGYYVHHLGAGHIHRAAAIAAEAKLPVIGFSTKPPPAGWSGQWIRLPDDADVTDPAAADVTAGGTLHWVPRGHSGLRARMQLIGNELSRGKVRVMVVDVSVEVSIFARLYGIPVAVVAQPGDRNDRPHRFAYDLAELLLAPWPSLTPSTWPRHWLDKTVYLGALSRFDGRGAFARQGGRRVLVLWGSGGLDVSVEDIGAAAAATPEWHWDVLGPAVVDTANQPNLTWCGWVNDVWSKLGAADVVVTHAGQNALAEVAAARCPAVVVPLTRPHDEQHATAEMLRHSGIAIVATNWPEPEQWPLLLQRALAHGGTEWRRWLPGDGAARAAAVLEDLANAHR